MKPLDLTKPLESCDPERPLIGQPGIFAGGFMRGFIGHPSGFDAGCWYPDGKSNYHRIPNIRNVPEVEVMWAYDHGGSVSRWYVSKAALKDRCIENSESRLVRRTRHLDADGKPVGASEYVEEQL